MRLIDAEAYKAEMRKRQDACRAWKDSLDEESETYARAEQALATFIEAALTLNNAPTVAAIPIDWLIDKFAEAGKAIYYCKGDWRRNAEIMAACRTVMALWKEAGT